MSSSPAFFPPEFDVLKRENARLVSEKRELERKIVRLEGEIDRLDEYTQHRSSCDCGVAPYRCTCGLDLESHSRSCLVHCGDACNCHIECPDEVCGESPEIPVLESIDSASLDASVSRLEAIRRAS